MGAAPDLQDLCRWPVIVAPMAGGPSTPGLVVAAAEAGAVGFLAAGYKTAEAMAAEIKAVQAATAGAFGVNVFVPQPPADPAVVRAYLESLEPEAATRAAGAVAAQVGTAFVAVRRAAPTPSTRRPWPTPTSPPPPSPGPSAAAPPGASSTASCSPIPTPRRPTPRSTTPPGPCGGHRPGRRRRHEPVGRPGLPGRHRPRRRRDHRVRRGRHTLLIQSQANYG